MIIMAIDAEKCNNGLNAKKKCLIGSFRTSISKANLGRSLRRNVLRTGGQPASGGWKSDKISKVTGSAEALPMSERPT